MATHIFVNPDMTRDKGDITRLHVSSDPPTPVTITLFPSGKHERVEMNDDGFAISSDLFALTGGKTSLVIVTTDDPAHPTTAILRQKIKDDRMATLIPPEDRASGVSFVFPLEHLADGASLWVANGGPAEAVGVLQYGSPRAAVAAQIRVPRNGFQAVKLTRTGTCALLNITNGVNVVAHVSLDTRGNDFDLMTLLPVTRA